MENVFQTAPSHNKFRWENLGDIKKGRGDLGEEMPVLVYRLMQFTMLDVLTAEFGTDKANELWRQAGFLAGTEFAKHTLELNTDLDSFIANLQQTLANMKIGILRLESFDTNTGNLILTVGQDLDCSGLPITDETVCFYDEGFIAGILEAFTGTKYHVKEIDCWANGDRVCRFSGTVVK